MSLFFVLSGSFTSRSLVSRSIRPAQRMLLKWDTGQEVYMLNQNDVREKLHGLKGNIQNFFHKFQKSDTTSDKKSTAQADGVIDDTDEFTPVQDGEQVATAPRTRVIFSDGSPEAQKLVWDNEDAS